MLHGSEKIIRHKVGLLNLAEELGKGNRGHALYVPFEFDATSLFVRFLIV